MGTQSEDELWSRLRQKPQSSTTTSGPAGRRPQSAKKVLKDTPTRKSYVKKPKITPTNAKRTQRNLDDEVTLPLVDKKAPKQKVSKNRNVPIKKLYLIGGAVAVVVLIGGGVYLGLQRQDDPSGPQSLGITDDNLLPSNNAVPLEEVSFNPFFPADFEEREIVFNLQRQNNDEVAFYKDAIGPVEFRVAQQAIQVTEQGTQGETQAESIAKALPTPAEQVAQVDGTTFYFSENDQDNQQSVVFAREGVLVIISAQGHIDELTWASYIANLRQ